MKAPALSLIALLSAAVTFSAATAQQESGKEPLAVPAIAEGLVLHSLLQSNMVLQREKPIAIWGWAGPGEGVASGLQQCPT
jgi:sialate O-acetylesterase